MASLRRSSLLFALAMSLFVFTAFSFAQSLAAAQGLPPAEDGAKARLNSSPRHGEWASFPAGAKDSVSAWVVYPERPDPAPVVLVVHEIFGLSDWVRSVADQLAAEGFIAIAPDLLSGKGPGGKGTSSVDPDGARALIAALDPAEVKTRLDATADYALALPAAAKSLGVVGFCWGGGISFNYATQRPDLRAAVSFYGVAPPASSLARIKAPVLALYGGSDARVTSTEAPAAAELKRLGKSFESAIYAGAGHAFMRQQGGMNGANLEAATKSWPKTIQFLRGAFSSASGSGFKVEDPTAMAVSVPAYFECCGTATE